MSKSSSDNRLNSFTSRGIVSLVVAHFSLVILVRMPLRRTFVALALVALPVVAALGCSADPYAPKALWPVVADTVRVLALSGTAPEAQSAIRLLTGASSVPDFSQGFDFALDIDAGGKVILMPRSKVVTCISTCQLGIRLIPADSVEFDKLYDAPKSGYTYDSVTTIPVGRTVAFVTKEIMCQASNIQTYDLYAKMIIDSVRLADRAIFARIVADPNCGFRGLVPGVTPAH
jgi:hypothetical protein